MFTTKLNGVFKCSRALSKWYTDTKLTNKQINETYQKTITENTVISRQHLTPEIALRLITEDCLVFHKPLDSIIFENDPFWGFYWPGGQALTRFILDNPKVVKGNGVLDIGAGCGASSIAAVINGATQVTVNDIDHVACAAALINADLNLKSISEIENFKPSTANYLDTSSNLPDNCDVILIGDMFYNYEFANSLIEKLKVWKKMNKQIYIGDPGRHELKLNFKNNLQLIESYRLPENVCIENNGFKYVNVWKF